MSYQNEIFNHQMEQTGKQTLSARTFTGSKLVALDLGLGELLPHTSSMVIYPMESFHSILFLAGMYAD